MQVFLLTLDLQQFKTRDEQDDVRNNSTIEFYFVNFFCFCADEDVLIFSLSEKFSRISPRPIVWRARTQQLLGCRHHALPGNIP